MGDTHHKAMFVEQKIKIKRVQMKTSEFLRKLHQQAKRIALAVVIMEFVMAGTYAGLVKYEVLPLEKEVIVVERVIAKEIPVQEQTEATEEVKEITRADEIADIIYLLESTNGKFDEKCERLGENSHNGYGYRQGVGRNYCLESDEAMREEVIKDIEIKIARHPQATNNEILCLYNSGDLVENCKYIANL